EAGPRAGRGAPARSLRRVAARARRARPHGVRVPHLPARRGRRAARAPLMDPNAKITLIGQVTAGALTAIVLVALLVSIIRRRQMEAKTPWRTPAQPQETDDRPEME